jgi:transaldolase
VAEAYLRALETRVKRGQRIDSIASVASLFVSRVDTEVDERICRRGDSLMALRSKAAVAQPHLAYAAFMELSRNHRWRALQAKGARPQRLLWASAGTKNPEYSDVLYVESLIGRDTITSVPPATLRLFEDHGRVSRTLGEDDGAAARQVMEALGNGGIDFADVNHTLEEAGIDKFAKSLDALLDVIARKRRELRAGSTRRDALTTCLCVAAPNTLGDDRRTPAHRISCTTRR